MCAVDHVEHRYRSGELGVNVWERRAAALRAAATVFEGKGSIDSGAWADKARDEVLRMAALFLAFIDGSQANHDGSGFCPKCGTDLETVTGLGGPGGTVQCRECGTWAKP